MARGLHPIVPPVGIGALAGFASAALYVGSATGSPLGLLLSFFAVLPHFVAGLGWGLPAALTACVVSSAGLALTIGQDVGGIFFLTIAAPAALLSHLCLLARPSELPETGGPVEPDNREWYPAGRLALWLAGIAVTIFLLLEAFVSGFEGGLRGTVIHALNLIAPEGGELQRQLMARFPGVKWDQILHAMATMVPAAAGVSWQFMMVCHALLAQTILSASRRALRPSFAPASLTLPRAYTALVTLALLLTFMGGQVGFMAGTIAAYLYVPYFFLGLTVVHAIPVRGAGRALMLALFYFLILVEGPLAIAVGLLGLVEQWTGLRARFEAARAAREDK